MVTLRYILWSVALTAMCMGGFGSPTAIAQSCGEWTELTHDGPAPRSQHAMAYDSNRGVTYIFGGRDTGHQFRDLWMWDGAIWTEIAQSGPSSRFGHAMIYDSGRDVLVLFGGWDGATRFNDTWEWDGQQWELKSQTGPLPRYGHAMVYDELRGATVIHGGSSERGLASDTWAWDGVRWVQFGGLEPGARVGHAMVFDSVRGVSLLFGGVDSFGNRLADLWQWNGEWSEIAATGPSGRYAHALAFDLSRGDVMLYGGIAENGEATGELWEWNGEDWRILVSETANARFEHKMVFDAAHDQLLAFGGVDSQWEYLADLRTWVTQFTLLADPADAIIPRAEGVEFSVIVEGPNQPALQWRREGVPLQDGGTISGATTDTLVINRAYRADAGRYDCVLIGACGEITSRAATLTIVDPELQVSPTCPGGGPIAISWQLAYPAGQVAVIFASDTGRFMIPSGYPCEGTRLGLGVNQLQIGWQGGAGSEGARSINGSAGPAACDGFMQLLDLSTCTTSNVVRLE